MAGATIASSIAAEGDMLAAAAETIAPLHVDMEPRDRHHDPIEVRLVPMPHHALFLMGTPLMEAVVHPAVTTRAETTINADPKR